MDGMGISIAAAASLGAGFAIATALPQPFFGYFADRFGRRAFASITGVSMIPMNILLLVAPLFAGIMFDQRGSYTVPFLAVAIVSFFGAAMFLLLREPPSSANNSH